MSVSHLSVGAQCVLLGSSFVWILGIWTQVLGHFWQLVLTTLYSSCNSFLSFPLSKVLYLRYNISNYKLIFTINQKIVNNIYLIPYNYKTAFYLLYPLASSKHLEAEYMENNSISIFQMRISPSKVKWLFQIPHPIRYDTRNWTRSSESRMWLTDVLMNEMNSGEISPLHMSELSSDCFCYIFPNIQRDSPRVLFLWKTKKASSPCVAIYLSFISLICVSHDWVSCVGNHQSIIPNRENSDKTLCSWLQPVWLQIQYCTYSRKPEWIGAAVFERMSICSDLITIWRWVQLSSSKRSIIMWHFNCCVIFFFWKACWVSNTNQRLHELSMAVCSCAATLIYLSQQKSTQSHHLFSMTAGRPVLAPWPPSLSFWAPACLINLMMH